MDSNSSKNSDVTLGLGKRKVIICGNCIPCKTVEKCGKCGHCTRPGRKQKCETHVCKEEHVQRDAEYAARLQRQQDREEARLQQQQQQRRREAERATRKRSSNTPIASSSPKKLRNNNQNNGTPPARTTAAVGAAAAAAADHDDDDAAEEGADVRAASAAAAVDVRVVAAAAAEARAAAASAVPAEVDAAAANPFVDGEDDYTDLPELLADGAAAAAAAESATANLEPFPSTSAAGKAFHAAISVNNNNNNNNKAKERPVFRVPPLVIEQRPRPRPRPALLPQEEEEEEEVVFLCEAAARPPSIQTAPDGARLYRMGQVMTQDYVVAQRLIHGQLYVSQHRMFTAKLRSAALFARLATAPHQQHQARQKWQSSLAARNQEERKILDLITELAENGCQRGSTFLRTKLEAAQRYASKHSIKLP